MAGGDIIRLILKRFFWLLPGAQLRGWVNVDESLFIVQVRQDGAWTGEVTEKMEDSE